MKVRSCREHGRRLKKEGCQECLAIIALFKLDKNERDRVASQKKCPYRAGPENEVGWDYSKTEDGEYIIHSGPNRAQKRKGFSLSNHFLKKTRGAARTRTFFYEDRTQWKAGQEQRSV